MKKVFGLTINIIKFSFSTKLTFVLGCEIAGSIIVCLVTLMLFLHFGDKVLEKEVFSFDASVSNFLYSLRSNQLTQLMILITFFGGPIFILISSFILMLYLYTKRRKDALIFSAILYSGILMNLLLKGLFHRPRPTIFPLVHENSFSFPSGHAMNSFVFYAAVCYFILRETKNVKLTILASICSAILIIAIGVSRIYLGAHFPSDVIAGYIAGLLWFTSAILFEKTIIFERLYKSMKKN